MSATPTVSATAALNRREVSAGVRFEFGKNWRAFLSSVDEPRIRAAEASLLSMLRCHDLYMAAQGRFDIVSSWGVLHHIGRMWDTVAAACRAVGPEGMLFSRRWRGINRLHNRLPRTVRPLLTAATIAPEEGKALARLTISGRPLESLKLWTATGATSSSSRARRRFWRPR